MSEKHLPIVVLADLIPQTLTLEEEIILPAQVEPSTPPETGVRKLMRGILETALRDLASSNPHEVQASQSWIDSGEEEYIFSFRNICQVLGVSPDTLQRVCILHGPAMRRRLSRGHQPQNTFDDEED